MASKRAIDTHYHHGDLLTKPRRPQVFDASYDPTIHCLMFNQSGHLVGYRPRAAVPQPNLNLNQEKV